MGKGAIDETAPLSLGVAANVTGEHGLCIAAHNAGKLNFYVALVDDVLRREHHNETIGILIRLRDST